MHEYRHIDTPLMRYLLPSNVQKSHFYMGVLQIFHDLHALTQTIAGYCLREVDVDVFHRVRKVICLIPGGPRSPFLPGYIIRDVHSLPLIFRERVIMKSATLAFTLLPTHATTWSSGTVSLPMFDPLRMNGLYGNTTASGKVKSGWIMCSKQMYNLLL